MASAHSIQVKFRENRLWPFLFLLVLAGCAAVGPDYHRPEVAVPTGWHTPAAAGMTSGPTNAETLSHWWETIDDPILTRLIHKTADRNLDIRQALAGIRKARAQRMANRAALFPTADTSGSVRKSRGSGTSATETELYSAGFDASWEIDLFGGTRRSVEAAQADLEASQENFHEVMAFMLAEVGVSYVEMRTYQARLAMTQARTDALAETLQLVEARFTAGDASALEIQQARYNLESARAEIPTLKTGLEKTLNSLAVLTGQPPGTLHDELSTFSPLPDVSAALAVGVPAEALRHRPDVRKAERTLAAETAREGVAAAELYPKLTLSGSIGLESLTLGNLFTSASRSWGIGPSVSWPLFDAGAVRSRIAVQSAVQKQALLSYESTVLSALEEVENALVAYGQELERRDRLQAATEAARSADRLAKQQYETGIVDFSDVLDAQHSLLSFENQLAQSRGEVLADLIRIYKALGGGWTPLAPSEIESHATERDQDHGKTS